MKKLRFSVLYSLALMLMVTLTVNAVPAKRGIKRIITLTDGSKVEVELRGDEHLHYYQDNNGDCYMMVDDNVYELQSETVMKQLKEKAGAKKQLRDNAMARKVGEVKDKAIFRGKRKGLIILANFTDKKFSMDDPNELYVRIANEKGFSDGNFKGSVSDYFHDNSYGKFELSFDIVGPIELAHNIAYYGRNNNGIDGNDIRPEQMIREAVLAADEFVDFNDYDWDGDGEVDQVFVVYAGYNEAQGGPSNTIWPHMYMLDAAGIAPTLDGVKVNTYACSSELANASGTNVDGIGTICHEFSHCMGFPDMYDLNYRNFGMSDWSLMNSGNYNGDGFCPAAYTSYERMVCGWLEPIELTDAVSVVGMKGLTEGGESYIIYGDNLRKTEYYLLENRQPVSWDKELPGKGLLILHVDYDQNCWSQNIVNTIGYGNGHQRLTIFHADNEEGDTYNSSLAGDPYPYRTNNSWTANSVPAAIQYNGTNSAKALENREVTDITLNNDGTIDFKFRLAGSDAPTYTSVFLDKDTKTPLTWTSGLTYNVHSNRLFASDQWETLWLPFDMTNDQIKNKFGNKTKIAKFVDVDAEGAVLKFETTDEGIKANTPVLIKVSTNNALNDFGTVVQVPFGAVDNEPLIAVSDYVMTGLRTVTTEPSEFYALNVDYFFNEYESEDVNYDAYNAFITLDSDKQRKGLKIEIDGVILNDDVDTSLINDPVVDAVVTIITDKLTGDDRIYTIDGRLINRANIINANRKLQKGIYIVNGKKVIL